MADGSCSGSTPFKSLIDHGSQDRSLHQDRNFGTPNVQHGFRSSAPSSSTPAQAQVAFGAFVSPTGPARNLPTLNGLPLLQSPALASGQGVQRSSPGLFVPSPQISTSTGALPYQQQRVGNASTEAASWAEDFTRLSRGSPATAAVAANHGFLEMRHQTYQSAFFGPNPTAFAPGPSIFGGLGGPTAVVKHSAISNPSPIVEADFDREMDQWMAVHGDSQVEDVDAVMEELARELEQQEAGTASTPGPLFHTHNEQAEKTTARDISSDTVPVHIAEQNHLPEISQLEIDTTNRDQTETPVEVGAPEYSEISEAARQILESVQHEQSDKWKNSRFLLLMRDFRDGHKDIVDNEITETGTNGRHGSGGATVAEN